LNILNCFNGFNKADGFIPNHGVSLSVNNHQQTREVR
jgi:hypothetical protein